MRNMFGLMIESQNSIGSQLYCLFADVDCIVGLLAGSIINIEIVEYLNFTINYNKM